MFFQSKFLFSQIDFYLFGWYFVFITLMSKESILRHYFNIAGSSYQIGLIFYRFDVFGKASYFLNKTFIIQRCIQNEVLSNLRFFLFLRELKRQLLVREWQWFLEKKWFLKISKQRTVWKNNKMKHELNLQLKSTLIISIK